MAFRACENTSHQIALNDEELTLPIDVVPLQSNLFAEPESSPKREQDPRVPPWEVPPRDGHQQRRLGARQRLYHRLRVVAAAEVPAQSQRGIGGDLLVLHELRE